MKILVVYYINNFRKIRSTILEHLYSIKEIPDAQCFFWNSFFVPPKYLYAVHFDVIIYHYTYFALKWRPHFFEEISKKIERFKNVDSFKIAILQDEYLNTSIVNDFLKEQNIQSIFSLANSKDCLELYPIDKSNVKYRNQVLSPGYISKTALKYTEDRLIKHSERPVDIAYRARKNPFWLGEASVMKWKLSEVFENELKKHSLIHDISTKGNDAFMGNDWYDFLLSSRAALGCEGGASIHDKDGIIRNKVREYIDEYPNAAFEEVKKSCFPDDDWSIHYLTISPRNFDCAITKTCQVLIEGEYSGILKPNIHYIPLKKDYSNIDSVINKLYDIEYCERIAETTYNDIVASGKYMYSVFSMQISDHINNNFKVSRNQSKIKNSLFKLIVHVNEIVTRIGVQSFYQAKRIKSFLTKQKYIANKLFDKRF